MSLRSALRQSAIPIGIFVATAAGTTLAGRYIGSAEDPDRSRYLPQPGDRKGGWQLVMVFIGASNCGWCNEEWLPPAIERAKLSLAHRAAQAGYRFVAVGIAMDWRVEDGVRFLGRFGHFDEISTGYGWNGLGAFHYIWKGLPGQPSTPQIVLVARYLALPEQRGEIYALQDEQLILRKVGVFEIQRWVNAEAPVSLPKVDSLPDEERAHDPDS